MIRAAFHRARRAVEGALRAVGKVARDVIRPTSALGGLVADLTRTHEELIAENTALRQQLILALRRTKRPKLTTYDRAVLLLASAFTRNWRETIVVVKAETVLRWHRQGFRLFWRKKSKPGRKRKPKIPAETIALIQRMSRENADWGAERIRGELLKLGLHVAKPTVQRYMVTGRSGGDGQRWSTFLKNHTVWACDFVQTYDCWFRPIFAFFIVDVNTKEVIHVAATRAPSETWTAQQLREVTPFGVGPDVIIRDRDSKFGTEFDRVAEGAEMRAVKTPVRTPNMHRSGEFHEVELSA